MDMDMGKNDGSSYSSYSTGITTLQKTSSLVSSHGHWRALFVF